MRESAIQSAIVKKLKKAGYLVNTLGAPAGFPDIRSWGPDGRAIVIEVKRKGKKPTELQEIYLQKFRDRGYEAYFLDNSKEIDKIILNKSYK